MISPIRTVIQIATIGWLLLSAVVSRGDQKTNVTYQMWFRDGYGTQELYLCLLDDGLVDGSIVIKKVASDETTLISWRMGTNDLSHIHDAIAKASFWSLSNSISLPGTFVVHPGYVRVDVKEAGRTHSVTQLYHSDNLGMQQLAPILIAILECVPTIENEFTSSDGLLAVLNFEKKGTRSPSQRKLYDGIFVVVTSNVVQAAFSFDNKGKHVIVEHDCRHTVLRMPPLVAPK